MEAQLTPLQSDTTSGAGRTLTVPDPARMVYFIIRSLGRVTGGEVTFECCPMDAVPKVSSGFVWREMKTVPVPQEMGVVTGYWPGSVSGMFRARISTPVTGGTITVWPLVGVLIGNANAALEPIVR
jgi:hypothetical protein